MDVLFSYQGDFLKVANSAFKNACTEAAELNSIIRNLVFHDNTRLNSIRFACIILPSGGWNLVGVGENDGDKAAHRNRDSGTDTSSMQIG